MDDASVKHPPHSIEAEQSVLGGLMLRNNAWYDLAGRITEDDFYREDHRLIFRGIRELLEANKPADFVTLSEYLRERGALDPAGGLSYLGALANDTPSAANVSAYADIVRERAVLRGLIKTGQDIADMGFRPDGRGPGELLEHAEQRVFAIREQGDRAKQEFQHVGDALDQVEERLQRLRDNPGQLVGLPTGLVDLDRKLHGFSPTDLIIVAGRPGMGKCLAHDAEIVLDDGSVATIEQVYRERPGRVGTLKEDLRLGRALPSDYVDDGSKPVFEVTTRLGRRVETTQSHPFLTLEGWKPLLDIREGDYIAVPRALPVFGTQAMRKCEIKLLAYLIGDGGLTGSSPKFTTTNPAIQQDFAEAVADFGGLRLTAAPQSWRAPSWTVVADRDGCVQARAAFAGKLDRAIAASGRTARALADDAGVSPAAVAFWRQGRTMPDGGRLERLAAALNVEVAELAGERPDEARRNRPNPLRMWLTELGLYGTGAHGKHIPQPVFRLPREQLALFLNRLFATDGWATVLASGQPQLGFASVSEQLVRQVQHLLLRFGIIARLKHRWVRYRDTRRAAWQLDITHGDSIRRFLQDIGMHGKQDAVSAVAEAMAGRQPHATNDTVPVEVWHLLDEARGNMSWAELARRAGVDTSNVHAHRRAMGRQHLAKFAMALQCRELMDLANSDVYWDKVVSITALGDKQVYDLTIPDTHNFIANDVCVHNTSLALNFAEHVAINEKQPVGVFSMEMGADQLAMRILASYCRMDQSALRSGQIADHEWDWLAQASRTIREAPLYIDETPALSPLELRARARRMKRRHGLSLLVVDYIQLMQVPGTRDNRTNEISEISRSLKALAKELNVPVIALSQLSREVEKRENKRPVMSDLRESGSIEQDADIVVFIYRDAYYRRKEGAPEEAQDNRTEIIIAKHRNGPTGVVNVAFLGPSTRFENLAHGEFP